MRIMGLSLKAEKGRGWGLKKKAEEYKEDNPSIPPSRLGFFFRFHVYCIPKEPIGIE